MYQRNESRNILINYVFWLIPIVFSSIWPIYFKKAGLSDIDIALAYILSPLSAVLTIVFFNFAPAIDMRQLMVGGALFGMLSYLIILPFSPSPSLLAASFFIYGFSFFLYWVPFNIKYFSYSHNNAATSGTIYFSISGILSILLAVVGGIVFQQFGPFAFFLSSSVLFLPAMTSAFLLKKELHHHSLQDCIHETRGFRTLNFIEGTATGVFVAGTIVSLSLFDQPFYLSIFIAVVTIFSVFASFLTSYLSDKTKKRALYLSTFSVLTAFSTFAMGFFSKAIDWALLSSARNFFSALFWPFTTALLVDNRRNLSFLMVGREIFLNLGRIFGISAVIASIIFFSDVRPSFFFLGAFLLLYPFILHLKKRRIKVL